MKKITLELLRNLDYEELRLYLYLSLKGGNKPFKMGYDAIVADLGIGLGTITDKKNILKEKKMIDVKEGIHGKTVTEWRVL